MRFEDIYPQEAMFSMRNEGYIERPSPFLFVIYPQLGSRGLGWSSGGKLDGEEIKGQSGMSHGET